MNKSWILCLCVLLVPAVARSADFSQPKRTVAPLVKNGPVIDGKLNDKVWEQASRLTNFLDLQRLKKTVSEQTVVLLLRDSENLYLGFECRSADPTKIVARKTGRDARRMYKDDVVEVFIDPQESKNDCYQWIINSRGAIWDAELHRLPATETMVASPQWNSGAVVAGSAGKKAWFIEMKIPLKDLGAAGLSRMKSGKTWGLQISRENQRNKEFSCWSRAYRFSEPNDFGALAFTAKAVRETESSWQQQAGKAFLTAKPPERATYAFTRVFSFGPAIKQGATPAKLDPPQTLTVSPDTKYNRARGYGFTRLEAPFARASKGRGYGTGFSPLVKQFIGSRKAAEFSFNLPAGSYGAAFISGSHPSTYKMPTDTQITINGSKLRLENLIPFRAFMTGSVRFKVKAGAPVRVTLGGEALWLLNGFVVYPAEDEHQAMKAFDSLERDFHNYPVADVYAKASLWVEYPPEAQMHLTGAERKAGFALVNLPAAKFTPRNYAPQVEDSRGAATAITSPGERTTIQLGFYAVRSITAMGARVSKFDQSGIHVEVLKTRYTARSVGSGALKQWGYQPRTLWPMTPVDVEAGRTQPINLIIDVDKGVKPGVYKGLVEFRARGDKLVDHPFQIVVLPFSPENKRFTWSMYHNPNAFGYSVAEWKQASDYERGALERLDRTLLRDLRRHGIDSVMLYGCAASYVRGSDGKWHFRPAPQEDFFHKAMKAEGVAEEAVFLAGYDCGRILNEALVAAGQEPIRMRSNRYKSKGKLPPAFFDNLTELVRENIAYRKKIGSPAPAFNIWDEPGDIGSPALVPLLDAVRRAGGKTFCTLVPGCFPALHGKVDVRDYNGISLGVAGGEAASPEEIARIKKKDGSRYFVYNNESIMNGDPRTARFCFGYMAWAWNLDGLDPYKYWKISGDPLVGGKSFQPLLPASPDRLVVTTTSWEMFPEAIYDNKLVQHLEKLTANNDTALAGEAIAFLADLRKQATAVSYRAVQASLSPLTGAPVVSKQIWPACRYDLLRAKLAGYIMQLTGDGRTHPQILEQVRQVEKDAAGREAQMKRRRSKNLPPVRKGNLLQGGDFENLPDGKKPPGFPKWILKSHVQGKVVHSGRAALEIQQARGVLSFEPVRLTAGRNYIFRGWARRHPPKGEKIFASSGFWMHTWKDGRKQYVRRMPVWFPQAKPSFEWTKFEFGFMAESGEDTVTVWLYNSNSGTYIDDVELIELDD